MNPADIDDEAVLTDLIAQAQAREQAAWNRTKVRYCVLTTVLTALAYCSGLVTGLTIH